MRSTELLGTPPEALFGDRVEDRRGSSARHRVAAERTAQAAGVDGVHDLRRPGHPGQRQAAAERLPGRHQVRLDVVSLDSPDRPRAPDAGLHLVIDVEDAVLAAERRQPGREIGRHRDEAALALHGLENDAGHRRRIDVALEQELELVDGVVRRDAAIFVGRRREVDLRSERAEAELVGHHLAGHGHREEGPAVKASVERDDRRPARRHAGDLDRVLDRLGAGVDEDRLLLGAPAGRQLGQAPADVDVRLVEADHDALVEIAVDLLVHRRDRRRQAVAGVLTADPAREVDVLLAVDVLDPDALGPRDHDRRSRHATGDVALLLLDQALGLSVLSKRHASESSPFRSSRPWTAWRQRLA